MTSEKPSFHIWLASVLRQNKVAYAPINTDPAVPVFGCNELFGAAANDPQKSPPPSWA